MSKHEDLKGQVATLIRARATLIWITTREERRVSQAVSEAATSVKFEPVQWDCASGSTLDSGMVDPAACLAAIKDSRARQVWILKDFHEWLNTPPDRRALKSLAWQLQSSPREEMRTIVILAPPSAKVPAELAELAVKIEWSLPEKSDVAAILKDATSALGDKADQAVTDFDRAVSAAMGLPTESIAKSYACSLVETRGKIDPAKVAQAKKSEIAGVAGLSWIDPDPRGLSALGGNAGVKSWATRRAAAFSPEGKAYGLPPVKGMLLLGVAGCGKSLTAKCIATAFGLPLLRGDLGATKSKFVGDSETQIREMLAVVDACAPCVFWWDEIEKMLAGGVNGGSDGGVSTDQIGVILTWMAERKTDVFVVATANDVSALPPELFRRFDALFFVDLPTKAERAEILKISLSEYKRNLPDADIAAVAEKTQDFTGAEIAGLVPSALFEAFSDGKREPTREDLESAAAKTVPLAKTASEKIAALRSWCKGRAMPAGEVETATTNGRSLDLDD